MCKHYVCQILSICTISKNVSVKNAEKQLNIRKNLQKIQENVMIALVGNVNHILERKEKNV